jgi:signal transduction histidine kinase/DNA-binding response OmpR family regulator
MHEGMATPHKILVVEDDPEIRAGTVRLLAKAGYLVFEAENGARGLVEALAVRPDLILSDVAMPELDGIELCRQVRAHPDLTDTLFMFLSSARTQPEEQADGLDIGADGYIARPVNARELLSRVLAMMRILEANARTRETVIQADRRERLARHVLEALNDPASTKDAVRAILRLIKDAWGFEAVALRLREGADCPYYETIGFLERFVRLESSLCVRDEAGNLARGAQGDVVLECMCGNVLRGRTDPSQPFFTKGGSFWSNCTTDLLASTTQTERQSYTRNRCNSVGYESVALVPLRVGKETIGLLQMNDHRRNQFAPELIGFFEGLGASIGIAIGRKRSEEALVESQKTLDAIIESTSDFVWAVDPERFGLLTFNCGLRDYFLNKRGITIQLGHRPEDLFPAGDFVQRWREMYTQALGEGPHMAEYTTYTGNEILRLSFNLMARDGRVFGISAFGRDITDLKRAEAEKVKVDAQLRQSQKMESVGRLAGGVAHDFNNNLAVIMGHVEMALDHIDPSEPIHSDLEQIRKATQRSADLTRQLLAFARKQTIAPKVLNLNETVTGMLKMLRRLLNEDIDLNWQPAPDLWLIKVDPSQIDQILVNLCVNARDAISDVGRLTIETGNSVLDQAFVAVHADASPGEYVRLAATDTGCGMDQETQTHMFEPFFTTKGLGKGTGLGLATVYGAVKQNNGFLDFQSELGKGTTFTIYLPRHVGSVEEQREKAAGSGEHSRATILLVEDEPAVLRITKTRLERMGYTVLSASTAGEAMRAAQEHTGAIHLLLTDVIMPEMNGRDLAAKLLSICPQAKCLFMSGYTADVIAEHGILEEGVSFIQKPFSTKELVAKVREALDSGDDP